MSLIIEAELAFTEEVVLLSTVVEEQLQSGNGTVTEEFSKVKSIKLKIYTKQQIMPSEKFVDEASFTF